MEGFNRYVGIAYDICSCGIIETDASLSRSGMYLLSFTLYFTCIHQSFDDDMFHILEIATKIQILSLTVNNQSSSKLKFLVAAAARRRIKKQKADSESAQSRSDPQAENQTKGEDVESSVGVDNHHTRIKSAGEGSQAPGETKNAVKMAGESERDQLES